ncbi:hypothetical protein GCM10014715_12580 [Streptomyces spiralis]|uniref:Hydrolase n=1 Tax=Streptomyces spiralis TaxID=66376 RepID=A0A919DMV6_9ACTN|nr:hypothetical protein GCM10014715_12580 [Streptomyces spiralis]
MQAPHPPRPPYPPHSGVTATESDRHLVARLRDPDGGHHAVALLLARHWRATYDYAAICLAAPGDSAAMVATAAFRHVLRRLTGGAVGGALRPQLLVAARETVREWAADEAACAVLPELSRPSGGRGLRAVKSMTSEKRLLAERAFQALPGAFQCLLWHTEVEAEPITIPSGLLAMDAAGAEGTLEQAREQFRAGCVRAHRELAPSGECRYYNRLLDVPLRRGGTLLPDVRQHLRACRHCRQAAEQLGHFDGGLHVLLAEAVLGWGARRYLDSRPARAAAGPAAAVPGAHRASGPAGLARGGRRGIAGTAGAGAFSGRTGPWRGHGHAHGYGNRHRTALAVAVGLASLVLLATVLAAKGWTADRAAASAPRVTWGASGDPARRAVVAPEAPSASASENSGRTMAHHPSGPNR